VTMSPVIMTRPLGVVFAYEATTSLDALGENLREINLAQPSDHWIDLVVVLDKGVVGYGVQTLFGPDFAGWHGGPMDDNFAVPPFYVHLISEEMGELTLNRFFVNLMGHLTFYRRRSTVRFDSVLGKEPRNAKSIQGYQYNLKRQLVDVEDYHREGNFRGAKVRFNIRNVRENRVVGQIGWIPWQDGAVVSYSGELPPMPLFEAYFTAKKMRSVLIQVPGSPRVLSSVMPLTATEFEEITASVRGDFAAERCAEGEPDLGWVRKKKGE